jgi:tRNA U34 5-methylaminomethyl-2-thiouridine-forming methyltransferase MnmC
MESDRNKPGIERTRDGSTTLYSPRFSQHYHNPNGAVAESRIVFFETPGTASLLQKRREMSLFEMGFGTGLNLILMKDYLEATDPQPAIQFYSVEAFPVDGETASKFDFGPSLQHHHPGALLKSIFDSVQPGLNRIQVTEKLILHLFIGTFDKMPDPAHPPDIIFHDPFSPEVNPELWTPDVFKRIYRFSSDQAVLATYSAASKARAAMAVSGWYIARAPGALGKREMTLASPSEVPLKAFKRVNETRLAERYRQGDFENRQ